MPPSSSSCHDRVCMLGSRPVRALIASIFLCVASVVAHAQQAVEPETFGKVYHCAPGPWGDLQYYQVHLEMPEWMINSIARPAPVPTWYFPGGTEAGVRSLFQKAGLPVDLQDYLLDPAHRAVQDGVLALFPPLPDLIAMTSAQRAIIYSELAKSEINASQSRPICIT